MYNDIAMVDQFNNFLSVLKALDKEGVKYILVGGVAVIFHGIERFTSDIDIMARLGEVAVYENLEFEILLHQGIKVRIATPETLYNLKKDTLRQKDKFDAAYLKYLIDIRQPKNTPKKNPGKR